MDKILARKLTGKGAVLVEGAKWCGKTTTAEHSHAVYCTFQSPEKLNRTVSWPCSTLDFCSEGTDLGWIRMRPMSLWESGESTGEVSLETLFSGADEIGGISELDLERIAFAACRGGWPLAVDMNDNIALDQAYDYLAVVEQLDIQRADGVERDPARVHRLLRSYARHQGTQVNYVTISSDLQANEGERLDEDTIASYIKALKAIFVVEDMEAWNPNLRSKTAIRTAVLSHGADGRRPLCLSSGRRCIRGSDRTFERLT